MASNYDNSASFYDRLSRVVFGDALVKAQVYLLHHIPPGANVLIVGGGTGWILDEITKVHRQGLSITYVEISAKMIAIAQKRVVKNSNKIILINAAIEDLELSDFDILITPFLFDNYREQDLPETFGHIHSMLKPRGLWLNTDFQLSGKWWQYVLLKSMLLFFKILCGVESSKLPDVTAQFNQLAYKMIDEKTFYGDFVVTRGYRKI
ncbi:class I SAM-dependent methyltransferase [Inquilinus sp. KBS0705]|nr:class I SAM-dependent methyltransferase [Inquilinus sp. KBS0705]